MRSISTPSSPMTRLTCQNIAVYDCLCCHSRLLRHVRLSGIYWFCPHCRVEMPVLKQAIHDSIPTENKAPGCCPPMLRY